MPKPHRITTPTELDQAIAGLIAADARLDAVVKRAGKPPHRHRRKEGFEELLSIVVSQQLSVAAADTIFGRVKQKPKPCAPAASPRPNRNT
jgi:DNA-3-methyladenine glycosylase II